MGDFTFNIVGPTNSSWNVYASSENLVNWTKVFTDLTLTTNVDATNGNTNFIDTTVAGVSNRFYQLSNSTSGCTSPGSHRLRSNPEDRHRHQPDRRPVVARWMME